MELKKSDQSALVDCLLDMGQLLLKCGAEISRVEDTLSRMAGAYGCLRADVFVITSIISLSMEFPDTGTLTETRRIRTGDQTDFSALEQLNHISRSCCRSPMPVAELRRSLLAVSAREKPLWSTLLGSVLSAGSFAVFFGGSWQDGLAAAVFAVGICLMQCGLSRTDVAPTGANLLLSLVTGLAVGLICPALPALHADKILIGDIMLMIPGLAMINAIRNILGGNTISGLIRLTESLIWAAALAGGFMLAAMILEQIQGVAV